MAATSFINTRKLNDLLLHRRWPWHASFWLGYILFRFLMYYITVVYYPSIYLEYMLLSELLFVGATYLTIALYKRLFKRKKYGAYFLLGIGLWILYLYVRTVFQFYYLRTAPGFSRNSFSDMILNNITVVLVCFFFITACKYFKDGFIAQQFEAEKQSRQLLAEVNNLKSQIAPHFLFNTLNNLYGLAVAKSDKLPDLMLRLSDLLRHSLYETQKPFVLLREELQMLKGYIELESLRLEDSLKLEFDNRIGEAGAHRIAPLLLIVFVENAFKHAKLITSGAIEIRITASMDGDWFSFGVANNYNPQATGSAPGIGLSNVQRRLAVLYPEGRHELMIQKSGHLFIIELRLLLSDAL